MINFSSLFSSIPFFPCSGTAQRDKHAVSMNQIYLMRKSTGSKIPSVFPAELGRCRKNEAGHSETETPDEASEHCAEKKILVSTGNI